MSCYGLSASTGREQMNALFINEPGHRGNGVPMGAGAVLTAALARLLLKRCPSPPSCLA